jgi:hypothetical protein
MVFYHKLCQHTLHNDKKTTGKYMTKMMNKAQGLGLSLITRIAGSEVIDQFNLRKLIEKSLYQGSKAGFKSLSQSQKFFKSQSLKKQRLSPQGKNLFDLNLSEEQQMLVESMHQFAQEILYPLAARADHNETFPQELWQHAKDLGLNEYALPEALGGVADHLNIVSNILITEQLGRGDFSLAAGLAAAKLKTMLDEFKTQPAQQVLAKHKVAFQSAGTFTRSQGLKREVERAAFSVAAPKAGMWSVTTAALPNELVLVAVANVNKTTSNALTPEQLQELSKLYQQLRGQQELEDYTQYLKSKAKIK